MPDPISILGAVGSVASIVSAIRSALAESHVLTREDAQAILLKSEEEEGRLSADQNAQKAIAVIDPDLLDILEKRIRGTKKRIRNAVIIFDPKDLLDESERANDEICIILQVIKSNNGGELPSEELKRIWKSSDCANRAGAN